MNIAHIWDRDLVAIIKGTGKGYNARVEKVLREALEKGKFLTNKPSIMDEDDHHKEVYAYFGLAIFRAQVLESAIVNALVLCDLIPNRGRPVKSPEEWAATVDQFMDSQFENTMARLMKALRKVMAVPDELEQSLERSLKLRNFLAHRYFRERDMTWYTEQGRTAMIAELQAAGEQFHETDRMIDAAIRPLRDRYGFTDAEESRILEELKAEARTANG